MHFAAFRRDALDLSSICEDLRIALEFTDLFKSMVRTVLTQGFIAVLIWRGFGECGVDSLSACCTPL